MKRISNDRRQKEGQGEVKWNVQCEGIYELLAKFLDRWFKAYIGFESPHSVLNSASLADVLKDVSLPPGTTICSFDVVGLFPNIPKATTMQRMGELFINANILHNELQEFFHLLNI